MSVLTHQRPKLKPRRCHTCKNNNMAPTGSWASDKRWQTHVNILSILHRKMERRRKWGPHRRKADRAGTHSDRCRQSPENTSLKCKSLPAILSGCRLPPPWPWPGAICQPNPSRTRSFLCAETCRQTGGFEGPQPRAAQSFEASRKLRMQASKKGKLGVGVGERKQDIAALSLLIFFFLAWRTLVSSSENYSLRSSLSVMLNICIWISENQAENCFIFFWWRCWKMIWKSPLTIIQMTDIIKHNHPSAGWTGK